MEYHILASGSKGNSIFIYDQGNGLLIDCGISKRQLYTKLNQLGFHENDIHYVLLTHDHVDHNKNIGIFDQSIVYCGKGCIPGIDESHEIENYQDIQLDHYIITPFLSHILTVILNCFHVLIPLIPKMQFLPQNISGNRKT